MKCIKHHLLHAFLIVFVLAACNHPQKRVQQQVQPSTQPVDTTKGTDSISIPDSTRHASLQSDSTRINDSLAAGQQVLTLPVLDALFYEPDFAGELRSKLHLTPAKIEQMRTAAHNSVTQLNEYGGPDTPSARAAAGQFQQEIQSLIGPDKARELSQMVQDRYSQGVAGLAPTRPNFVPTDTRIVVNAPAFRMDIFEKGQLIKTYKVGIGYPEFPLPVGMRRADTIIFHPTWTPPDEPWVHGKFAPGRKVAATSKLNPLGVIKIPIGMPSLIHGGKSSERIGNFASHGCVGMTDKQVLNLVPLLLQLGQSDLSAEARRTLERHKTRTKKVELPTPVPVDLRYETIVAENGGLHIYRDVYERGTNTLRNAKLVLSGYDIKYEQLTAGERDDLQKALAMMNRDALGRPIDNSDSLTSSTQDMPSATRGRAKKGKVTSTIKGRTEVFVKLAALQGKGYPKPRYKPV